MEEWKPLTYHGEYFGDTYEISNYGRLRNIKSGNIRKLSFNKNGYLHCVISRGRKRKIAIKIHRAVAENFVEGNKEGLVINHKDGVKTNNNYKNLEFITREENIKHAVKHGLIKRGGEAPGAKLNDDQVSEIRKMYKPGSVTLKQISKEFGVGIQTVSDIINGKTFVDIEC